MALDPSIITGIRGPAPMPAFDPMEAMGQAQAFQVRKLAIEKAQRDAAAQARMQQLASQYGDDPDELIKQLGREFPEQAADIRKTRAEELHKGAQAKREEALAEKEQLAFGMSTMQGVTAANYPIRRQIAVKHGGEAADRLLPLTFDQAAIDSALQTTRSVHDYYDGIDKGAQAVLDGKHIKAIGLIFRSAKTPEMWQDATKVAQEGGFGKLAALLGPAPSPEGFARADEWAFGEDKEGASAKIGSFEDYVARFAASKGIPAASLSPADIEQARKRYQQADDRPIRINTGEGDRVLVPIIGPDGKPVLVRRSQAEGKTPASAAAGGGKPPTGPERAALGFFNRAKQASDDLEVIETQVANMGLAEQTRLRWAPNLLQTGLGQSYDQAQRAFTEARLRKDSGAAIPPAEFDNDRKTYFAQPGDTEATIKQKRRARMTILASLGAQSGRALEEFYGDEAATIVQDYRARAKAEPTKPPPAAPAVAPKPAGKKPRFQILSVTGK